METNHEFKTKKEAEEFRAEQKHLENIVSRVWSPWIEDPLTKEPIPDPNRHFITKIT